MGYTLIIAEKPKVARNNIAPMYSGLKKSKTHIEAENGKVMISWVFGHLFGLAPPDDYLSDDIPRGKNGNKKWRMDDLPIIPDNWKMKLGKGVSEQYKALKKLLSGADEVIHAGDPDREGQVIVDELLMIAGYRGKVKRVWLKDLTPSGVRKAFEQLEDNQAYKGYSDAGFGRMRADWLIGMNGTRAMTLSQGGQLLSVGRVQTPTLAFLVERDRSIENFKPKDYFEVLAEHIADNGQWKGLWKPDEDLLDGDNYLTDRHVAEEAVSEIKRSGKARIAKVEKKKGKTPPPLPHSLDTLQKQATTIGLSPSDTLAVAQSLYEAGLTSYPRTECQYLEEDRFKDAPGILKSLADFYDMATGANPEIKSGAWNDAKVGAHTAIIPTGLTKGLDALGEKERKVYDMIAKRFILQFYPPETFEKMTVISETEDGKYKFRATGKKVIDSGWKSAGKDMDEEGEEKESILPDVKEGDFVSIGKVDMLSKKTKPPKRFNLGEMPTVMKTITRYINMDKHSKDILKEVQGIGTSATRAEIVKTLINRGYIETKGKRQEIYTTAMGRELVDVVPEVLKDIKTTANWETRLKEIEEGKERLEAFEEDIRRLTKEIIEMIKSSRKMKSVNVPSDRKIVGKCPLCGGMVVENKKAYGCSNWREEDGGCKFVIWKNVRGKNLTDSHVQQLLDKGKTKLIKGFKGKESGKTYNGYLVLKPDGKLDFEFEKKK